MITNTLQKRINAGDREAFKAVYSEYGRGVYLAAQKALGSESAARSVVKQAFLNLHSELLNAADDVDIPVRIRELTDHELLLMKIIAQRGTLGEEESEAIASCGAANCEPSPEQSSARGAFEEGEESAAGGQLPPLERPPVPEAAKEEADEIAALKERLKEAPAARPRTRGQRGVVTVLIFLLLLLGWVLAGILMQAGVIPACDLGYRWFDQNIYSLFGLFA